MCDESLSGPDPVTVAVIRFRLEAIARQMGVAMQQTAISQLLNQAYDFSTAIFDASGRLVAQAEHIPIHIGAMPMAVRAMLARFEGDISEGDVLVSNDPYHGGSHLPDVTVVRPLFREGSPVFFVAVRAHHNDIGGAAHGGYNADAREILQEGLRIPPLKLAEGGRLHDDVLDMLALNVRHADDFRGDLLAQMGGSTGRSSRRWGTGHEGRDLRLVGRHVRRGESLGRRRAWSAQDSDSRPGGAGWWPGSGGPE